MNVRQLRRQRHVRMAWLVKRHPMFRGTCIKGARPFILYFGADGFSADLTPKRRIEKNRQRGPRPRATAPSPWLIRANAYGRRLMAEGHAV